MPDRPTPPEAPDLVQTVRAWVGVRLEDSSYRALAREIDIPHSTLEKFVNAGAEPQKIWPTLRRWYLADRRERLGALRDPEDLALLVLESLANVPTAQREGAVARAAEHFAELHRDAGVPVPDWVDRLPELAGGDQSPRGHLAEYRIRRRRPSRPKD